MQERFVRAFVLFFVLTVAFGILERLWPSIPKQAKWRKGVWLDTIYWFVTPVFSQILSMVCIGIVMLPLYIALGRSLAWDDILTGYGPIAQFPLWQQGAIAVIIGDFVGYWTHRLHHSRMLWDYHAIHHSSETMDWLSAVRLHPINDVVTHVGQAAPLLLLGFSPLAVEAYVPILSIHVAMIHANLSWNFGPFRYWLSSPAFHRWHHTMDKDGQGRNFAGMFPIYDILFGTYYLPKRQPGNFGIEGETMTEDFLGQILYPFRNWRFLKRFKKLKFQRDR